MDYLLPYLKRLHAFAGGILYVNLLGMGIISFFEGVAIFLLVPMLNMTEILGSTTRASNISWLFNFLPQIPPAWGIPSVLAMFITLVIAQSFLQRKLAVQKVKIVQGFINQIRLETYRDLLQSNWQFFLKKRKSDLINLLTAEIGRVAAGLYLFLQFSTSLVFTIIQIAIAFWISVKMTAFVLLFGVVLAFFSRGFIKKSKVLGNKTSELLKSYLAGITDQLNGIKDIKSNTLEESRLKWLRTMTGKMLEETIEHIELKATSQLFYKIASSTLIVVFIFFSIKMFQTGPEQFILIIVIFSRLWPKITNIQSSLEQLAASIPAFEALLDLQQECNEAREISGKLQENTAVEPIRMERGLECYNVYFRYNQEKQNYALQKINVYIPSNRMTAVVGRSGAGKSTLIDILMGLVEPEKGHVLVDGIPLTGENIRSLRQTISYVPQDPFLYNESIRDNLLLTAPDAGDEEIWEALQFAAADDFVRGLPHGLDTMIGDRGIRISGGERQRLVLTRAILRKPSILILDEATSALDSDNESKIQQALDRIRGTMTIIVIAHRLSTIKNADQVIVLEQGQVIQSGEYKELEEEKGSVFSDLLENQFPNSVIA